MYALNHIVNVVASPVFSSKSTACSEVFIVLCLVSLVSCSLQVEVVVKHNTVNIVVCDDFLDDVHDTLSNFRFARIKDRHTALVNKPIGVIRAVAARKSVPLSDNGFVSVRVKPRMTFHTALVTFFNHELEWVIAGVITTLSNEVFRPRFKT